MGGRGKGKKLPHFKVRRPDDKVFGRKKPLPRTKLPLYSEVGSALIFEAENDRLERELKEIDCKEATDRVTKDILGIYKIADVSTIDPKKVKEKVHDLWRMRREALKAASNGKNR